MALPNRKQTSVTQMIGRCHKWRQKRKQYIDQARITNDVIERERLLQMAEHYGRIVADEQGKIDNNRDKKQKPDVCPDINDADEELDDFRNSL